MLKGSRVQRKTTCLIENDKLINTNSEILDMWVGHYSALGHPTIDPCFNEEFRQHIELSVKQTLDDCLHTLTCSEGLFTYDSVKEVCLGLKNGVAGSPDMTTYEHIKFGGPVLWEFSSVKIPSQFKVELILPLFKGKGLEAHNKDNYRDIAMFSVFCKVFEMILLRKLEQIAEEKGYFSHMQFGFSEEGGCLEASYVMRKSINQLLEKRGKAFACFLNVRKAFDTVWIPGLLYKLKHELGIDSQLWLVIRELYKDVRGQVLFNGHVSDSADILQGSGQGRILAPFLYKVFINQLLREICQLKFGTSLFNYDLPCPSFADDMTLVSCYPSCLNVLMQLAYQYSCNWRYQFSYTKTSVVAFGESAAEHNKNKQTRNWSLCPDHIDEEDEYVNLGVHKNYCGSFSKNVDKNIAKTRKKASMLFSANFVRKCVNPMIYSKLWKQVAFQRYSLELKFGLSPQRTYRN